MPIRSKSQRIGDQAEHIVQGAFLDAPNWICRTQSHDFGVDLEAELTLPTPHSEEMSGAIIKLQVKGTVKPIERDNAYYIRLRNDFLRYARQFRIPVILVLVNVRDQSIHYLWVQEYLENTKHLDLRGKSSLIRIPKENHLPDALKWQLAEIALDLTDSSRLMAVKRLFQSFSTHYDQRAQELSSELLLHLDQDGHTSVLNDVIETLIARGPYLSRVDSQQFGRVLSNITRKFGDRISSDQVKRMLVRDESYSFAGLDGLSGLYDSFPDHARSLNLATIFDELELYELSWYCQFREAHAGLSSFELWGSINKLKMSYETSIGVLHIPEENLDYCFRKWPNRADAAFLQSLSLQKLER